MDKLRRSERTAANRAPGKRMLYGLMPPSISHEGYSAKPQYSLWDDFWAMRGYRRRRRNRRALLGRPEAAEIAALARRVRRPTSTPRSSPRATIGRSPIIPGATSLGDFDATSTTIALDPGNQQARLDPAMLDATFERYWTEFRARAAGRKAWKDYTPYETRVDRQLRPARLARPDRRADRLLHGRPPPGGLEPVGRSRRPRRARNPLHRRHAARLGGVGFRPRRARHVRLGPPRRSRAGARRRAVAATGWPGRARRSAGWRRPTAASISRCAARPRG